MVRYRQELFFGCYADPDLLPEVHELPALIEGELEALAAAGGRATPAPDRVTPTPRSSAGHTARSGAATNGHAPLVPVG